MAAPSSVDVLVVGAGPVGLTLANEVLRRGASVRVVEKLPTIHEISKALIWHVRTQEALAKVGILERGLAEARPLREVVLRAYGKRIGTWHFSGIESPYPNPVIIGQNRTEHLLADLFEERGGTVEYGTEAIALDPGADAPTATVTLRKNGNADETVRARYVVGAEGSKSLVRTTLGLAFEGERYAGEQFIQADCTIAWALPQGRSYLFLTDDGYMMVIEMPGGLVRVFISLPDREGTPAVPSGELGAAEDAHAIPSLEDVEANLVRLSGIEARLANPTWLARYRTSHRYAERFRSGRCFVAGDAGHVHVPIGGQGMNTGIQDAFNLGWKLAGVVRGSYHEKILDSYDSERHPVAKALLEGTDRSYRGILHPSDLQQRLVRMFGPYVVRIPAVQHFLVTTLEELNVAYERSPLNVDLGSHAGPAPGRRAPGDATIVRWKDRATLRFAELTSGDEWVLLVFEGASTDGRSALPNDPAPLPENPARLTSQYVVGTATRPREFAGFVSLVDAEGELHRAFGVASAATYLLRPDFVVALRMPGYDRDALVRYFSTTLGAT